MSFDPALLSRIQFAANISFHIIFPSITIALSWFLVSFKLAYNKTNDTKWIEAYSFFSKIFALCFAVGVVSGITMSFQFGTNWPGFMEKVGNVAGPLLGYEVLTAFFLEATFLGIMLFGINRVPNWLHTLATFFVAFGTTLSSYWILVLSSWMQTPAGFEMINDVAHATNWREILWTPSFPYRFTHKLMASEITASFLIMGLCSYRILRNDKAKSVMAALKTAIITASILTPLQLFVGDLHVLNTLKHQPAKIAAIEGLWETQKGAPLVLFGFPNKETKTNDFSIKIPNLASLFLTHDLNGEVKGINEFGSDHPPVAPVFWAFRIMVGLGLLMIAVSWIGVFYIKRKKEMPLWLSKIFTYMTFSGCAATIAGWYVTEIGRQPWLVTGVLRTVDAVTKVPSSMIGISLFFYTVIYCVLLVLFFKTIFYISRNAQNLALNDHGKGEAVSSALKGDK